jgi:hypothetical protein
MGRITTQIETRQDAKIAKREGIDHEGLEGKRARRKRRTVGRGGFVGSTGDTRMIVPELRMIEGRGCWG